jgi:hypothetical protein
MKGKTIVIMTVLLIAFGLFVLADYNDFGDVVISGYLNMSSANIDMGNNNLTNTSCMIFQSGGQICSSP